MRRAFTLIEILIAIALVGIVTTFAVVRLDSVLDGLGQPGLEDALDEAVRSAREAAAESKRVTWLAWDAEQAAFVLSGATGKAPTSIPTAYGPRDGAKVTFLVTPPAQGRPGASRAAAPDPVEVESLPFGPDRSGPAFTARLEEPGSPRVEIRYDAFSPSRWPEEAP